MTTIGLVTTGNRVDLVNTQPTDGQTISSFSSLDVNSSSKKGIRKAEWYHIGRRTQITIGSKTVYVVTDSLAKYLARTSINHIQQTEKAKKTAFKAFKKVALMQAGEFASATKIGNLLQRHIAVHQHRQGSNVVRGTVTIPTSILNITDAETWEAFFTAENEAYNTLSKLYHNSKSSSFIEALDQFNRAHHARQLTAEDTKAITESVLNLQGNEISTISQKLQDNAKVLTLLNPSLQLKEQRATLKASIQNQEARLEQLTSEFQDHHQIEESFARLEAVITQDLSSRAAATILTISDEDLEILNSRGEEFAQKVTDFNTFLKEYKQKLANYETAQQEYASSEEIFEHTSKLVNDANAALKPLLDHKHTPTVEFSKESREAYLTECEKMGIYQIEHLIHDLKEQLAQNNLTAQDTQRTKDIAIYNTKLEQQKKLLSFFALNPAKRQELLESVNASIQQTEQQIEVTHASNSDEWNKAIQLGNLEPHLLILQEQRNCLELLIQNQASHQVEQTPSEDEQATPVKKRGMAAKLKEKASLLTKEAIKGASLATKVAATVVSKAATKAMKVATGKNESPVDVHDPIQQAKADIEAKIEGYKEQIKTTKTIVKVEHKEVTEQNEPVQFVIQQLQHILAQKKQHFKMEVQNVCKTFNLNFKEIKDTQTDIFERLTVILDPLSERYTQASQTINTTKQALTQSLIRVAGAHKILEPAIKTYQLQPLEVVDKAATEISNAIETMQTQIETLEVQLEQQWQESRKQLRTLRTIVSEENLDFDHVYKLAKQAAIVNRHFLLAIANSTSDNLTSIQREIDEELKQMNHHAATLDNYLAPPEFRNNPFILDAARESLLGQGAIETYLQTHTATDEELRSRSNSTRSAASHDSGLSHTSDSSMGSASSANSIYTDLYNQASTKSIREVLFVLDDKSPDFFAKHSSPLFNAQTKLILEMTLLDGAFVKKFDLEKMKKSTARINIDQFQNPLKLIYQVLLQGARDQNNFKLSFQGLFPRLSDLAR